MLFINRILRLISRHTDKVMFVIGFLILAAGLSGLSLAAEPVIDTKKIKCASFILLYLTEGDFGALVMVVAGLSTIIASAFGAFRAASAMLVVACAAFILRSLVEIWFHVDYAELDSPDGLAECGAELGSGEGAPGGEPE